MDRLRVLHGTWRGRGAGDYPTIDAFKYEETLRFEFDSRYPMIHYEQRTFLMPSGEASHWESGFIRVVEGSVEFHFRVDELVDNKRAAWTCVAAPKVPDEWVDTRVTFDLDPTDDGGTVVGFSHTGWESVEGAYAQCNTVWGELMHRLRDYVEGNPRGPYFEG